MQILPSAPLMSYCGPQSNPRSQVGSYFEISFPLNHPHLTYQEVLSISSNTASARALSTSMAATLETPTVVLRLDDCSDLLLVSLLCLPLIQGSA